MNVHKNARLTAHSRGELVRRVVDEGQPRKAVAATFIDRKTVAKWIARFEAEGAAGLADRSSRPRRLRRPIPPETQDHVIALRRQRFTGQQIARDAGVSPATVSRILRRARLSRIRDLEPVEPVVRYQREQPGEMIHLDIKKLGRFDKPGHRITGERAGQSTAPGKRGGETWGAGWEFVHVCIDDAARIAFSQILPDEKSRVPQPSSRPPWPTTPVSLRQSRYTSLGVTVTRVMINNGACYKAFAFTNACKALGLKHGRTRPYTPKTNGKAERVIQTARREWAYAQSYQSSDRRAAELPVWLHRYNWHRPHAGIKLQTPISRLSLTKDNLLSLHN